MPAKAKISVTVPAEVLSRIDRGVRQKRWPSRSAVVQLALAEWAQRERERRRDAEIEAYYLRRTPEEIADDEQWASFADAEFVAVARDERATKPVKPRRSARRR